MALTRCPLPIYVGMASGWRKSGEMTEYLLERYPDGTYETFEYDDATGNITVRRWADVQPAIDANKAAHLDGDGKGKFAWHAASIPEAIAGVRIIGRTLRSA
jgi:hypothetical protein